MKNTTQNPSLNQVERPDVNDQNIIDNQKEVQPDVESPFTETKKRPIDKARDLLKAQSRAVRELVDSGKYKTVNDALIETVYNDEKHHEFKSYDQWSTEGYQVRKGEKGFLLWGKPKEHEPVESKQTPDTTDKETKDEHYSYFPVIRVFSDAQVDQKEHQIDKPEKEESNIKGKLGDLREQNTHDEIAR